MPDKEKASRLAREGFDLWQSGRLEEAVLAGLDRAQESREEYERALADTIRQAATENEIGVIMARWFLGQHLLKMHRPQEALAAVEPSLSLDPQGDKIDNVG